VGDALSRPTLQGMPLPQQPLPGAPLPTHRTLTASAQTEAMKRAAQEFEAVFLNQMLAPMFEGLSTDGLGGGGVGEEMFRPMLIDTYAKSIAQSGGVGVAANIVAEFTRMQAQAADGDARASNADTPAILINPPQAPISLSDEDGPAGR
jgi:Rod binding domain-containing protein